MTGIIGKKVGMTNFFSEDGKSITCTVIEAGPCYVTEIRNNENNGYEAVQIGFDEKSEKNTTKPLKGHFQKAGVNPLRKLVEFKDWEGEYKLGEEIKVDIFNEGDVVEVKGKTKGKGFQGVVKRHGFAGVGGRTHGQHNRERAPGSIGAASFPSRVFKGMKMAGRQGNDNVKVFNLEILKVMPEENLLFVKGSIPGHKGSYVIIEK